MTTHDDDHNLPSIQSTAVQVWFDILNGVIKRPYQCFWALTKEADKVDTRPVTTSADMLAIRQDEASLFQFSHPWRQKSSKNRFGTNKIVQEWERKWKERHQQLSEPGPGSDQSGNEANTSTSWTWVKILLKFSIWIIIVLTFLAFFIVP